MHVYQLILYKLVNVYFCCACAVMSSSFFNRLAQAYNHVAALLFYIAKDAELPTDKSMTFKPMVWNQPPKRSVSPACTMTLLNPAMVTMPIQKLLRL